MSTVVSSSRAIFNTENRVLKNTFLLLSATFLFSALMALTAMTLGISAINPWLTIGVYIALIVLLHFNQNNGFGVLLTFALTGWLGFTLGPIISMVMDIDPWVVASSFMMSAAIFVGLSLYALTTRKNFSYMGSFLTVGILVAFVAGLIALFFQIALLSLLVSAAFLILSSGVILWQVSEIVHNGETNYVLATVTLFASFYNIFLSLMNIFGYNSD